MVSRAVAAVLVALALAATGPVERDRPTRPRQSAALADGSGPEVRDPLFAFLIAVAEGDSLGVWDRQALRARVEAAGRPTRLPLERVVEIERRAAELGEIEAWSGARVTRVWRVELDADLDEPMPWSILGYHPGSLRLSRELLLSEWRLGDANLTAVRGDSTRVFPCAGIIVWRIDQGWLVLDADGFVDRVLGAALDDAWNDGLALARVDGRLVGLAMGTGRDGRRLYGEFDFRRDKILAHGRPAARALSGWSRGWLGPRQGSTRQPWARP